MGNLAVARIFGTGTFLLFLGLGFGCLWLGRKMWRDRAKGDPWYSYPNIGIIRLFGFSGVCLLIALLIAIREPLF